MRKLKDWFIGILLVSTLLPEPPLNNRIINDRVSYGWTRRA